MLPCLRQRRRMIGTGICAPHLRLLVVQQAHPQGGQAADEAPGAAVRAAHLQEPLQPHLMGVGREGSEAQL